MDPDDRILVARGRCAGCGDPVAERARDEHPVDVACPHCGASTTLAVTAVAPRAPTAPPASAPAPRAAPPAATAPRARAVAAAVVGVLVLAGAGYGAAAYLGLVSGPAGLVGDDTDGAWRVLSVSVHHEVEGDDVVTWTTIHAEDADGNVLAPEDVQGVPSWAFAHSSALVEDPLDVVAWHTCDARECEYRAPADAWVYFAEAPGPGPGTRALHAANASMRTFLPTSGWGAEGVVENPVVTTFASVVPEVAGADHSVALYLVADDAARSVTFTLTAEGGTLKEQSRNAVWADESEEWVTTVSRVPVGATLTVTEDDATAAPVEVTLDASRCGEGGTLDVVVEALDGAPLRVREPVCAS